MQQTIPVSRFPGIDLDFRDVLPYHCPTFYHGASV